MQEKNDQVKKLQQAYRASYLIAGFIRRSLTRAEQEELDDWIVERPENMRLFGELTDEKNIASFLADFDKIPVEKDLAATKRRMQKPKIIPLRRIISYAAAACLLIVLGFYINSRMNSTQKHDPLPIAETKHDIDPGTQQATLQLENGEIVALDSIPRIHIKNYILASGHGGELIYDPATPAVTNQFHILSTPRKGGYKLQLPDGTLVWLNAESSIRYPVHFDEHERKVYVKGEVYFEVAKDRQRPFRAVAGDMTVEALGTQFNINNYSNEPFATATLVEGSVLVTKGKEENILKPGQQAAIDGQSFEVRTVDTNEVTGWTNGVFHFVNTPLDKILRQAERWYDAEVIYEEPVDIHLNATIERSVPVSRLLQLLEATGHIHFEIDGKKILVSKKG